MSHSSKHICTSLPLSSAGSSDIIFGSYWHPVTLAGCCNVLTVTTCFVVVVTLSLLNHSSALPIMLQNVSVNVLTVRLWATVSCVSATLILCVQLHFCASVFGKPWILCNQKHHMLFLCFCTFSLSWRSFIFYFFKSNMAAERWFILHILILLFFFFFLVVCHKFD